jgi:tetratricopeptide (TPR) repeat protein
MPQKPISPVFSLRPSAFAAVLAFAACAPPPADPRVTAASPDEALQVAAQLYHAGDYAGAEQLLAVHTRPPERTSDSEGGLNARILQLRSQVVLQRTDLPNARELAEGYAAWALVEDRFSADAWLNYVRVRRGREGYQGFAPALASHERASYPGRVVGSRAVARIPTDTVEGAWTVLRALLLAEEGKMADASAELDAIRGPWCFARHLRAWTRLRAGSVDGAAGEVQAIESLPACHPAVLVPSFHRLKAEIATRRNDVPGARQAFQEALRLDPSDLEAQTGLAQLASGVRVGGTAMGDARARVQSDPLAWEPWAELWESYATASAEGAREFRRLAEQATQQAPYAEAPRLAVALSRVGEGDFDGASAILDRARAQRPSPELLEARLALAAVRGSAYETEAAHGLFLRAAPGSAVAAASGWSDVVRSASHPELSVARQAAAARWLDAAGHSEPGRLFLAAGAEALLRTVLPRTAEGSALAMDILRERISRVEQRVVLAEGDLRRLDANAVALLTRVTGVEGETIRLRRQLVLTQSQVAALDGEVARVQRELPAMEARLNAAVARQDQRVMAAIDQLSRTVRTHDVELRQMGMDLSALRQGRSASRPGLVRDLLTLASGFLSFNPLSRGAKWGLDLLGGMVALITIFAA